MTKITYKNLGSPRAAYVARRAIATYYFESPTPETAVARMRRWINSDPELRAALEKAGYRPRQRYFTHRQIRVFRRFFGD